MYYVVIKRFSTFVHFFCKKIANRGTNAYGAAIWRMAFNRRHNEIIIMTTVRKFSSFFDIITRKLHFAANFLVDLNYLTWYNVVMKRFSTFLLYSAKKIGNRGTNAYGAAIWRMALNRRHNEIIIMTLRKFSSFFNKISRKLHCAAIFLVDLNYLAWYNVVIKRFSTFLHFFRKKDSQ